MGFCKLNENSMYEVVGAEQLSLKNVIWLLFAFWLHLQV